ncbi:hypothetical protein [Bacillus mobilis]|uniref:hypothetical protein n=1 Tax=Bacillus mobilis TaxID=2026190 RepID=UPI003CE9FFD8
MHETDDFTEVTGVARYVSTDCSIEEQWDIMKHLDLNNQQHYFVEKKDIARFETLEVVCKLVGAMVQKINENTIKGKNKSYYFYIGNNGSFNAFAYRYKDIDVYCLNVGVFHEVYEFFGSAISDKLFPEIDGDLELRKDIIYWGQMFVILYVVSHELGHIYDGHLDLLEKKEYFYMLEKSDLDAQMALDNRTIEMDADAFAMARVFNLVYNTNFNGSSNIIKKLGESFLYKLMMFSLHSFYLFFEEEKLNLGDMAYEAYFPIKVRQFLNLDVAIAQLKKSDVLNQNEIEDIFYEMCIEAEKTWAIYKGKDLDLTVFGNLVDPRITQYVEEVLFENWNIMRDKLDEYARLELAPKRTVSREK